MPIMPFIGDIYAYAYGFPPKGWAQCNGQIMNINQNQALYSVLGTVYGGNGTTTFALPNMAGRVPLGAGTGFPAAQTGGEASHTLTISELPMHNHMLNADAATPAANNAPTPAAGNAIGQSVGTSSDGTSFGLNIYSTAAATTALAPETVGNQGSGQPHENRQPYCAVNYCIALTGLFPSRG